MDKVANEAPGHGAAPPGAHPGPKHQQVLRTSAHGLWVSCMLAKLSNLQGGPSAVLWLYAGGNRVGLMALTCLAIKTVPGHARAWSLKVSTVPPPPGLGPHPLGQSGRARRRRRNAHCMDCGADKGGEPSSGLLARLRAQQRVGTRRRNCCTLMTRWSTHSTMKSQTRNNPHARCLPFFARGWMYYGLVAMPSFQRLTVCSLSVRNPSSHFSARGKPALRRRRRLPGVRLAGCRCPLQIVQLRHRDLEQRAGLGPQRCEVALPLHMARRCLISGLSDRFLSGGNSTLWKFSLQVAHLRQISGFPPASHRQNFEIILCK